MIYFLKIRAIQEIDKFLVLPYSTGNTVISCEFFICDVLQIRLNIILWIQDYNIYLHKIRNKCKHGIWENEWFVHWKNQVKFAQSIKFMRVRRFHFGFM